MSKLLALQTKNFSAKDVFARSLVIKKTHKGLKHYYISKTTKVMINKFIEKLLEDKSKQKEIFGEVLTSKQKADMKSYFGKYDKNNYFLSIILFLESKSQITLPKEITTETLVAAKLIGFLAEASSKQNDLFEKLVTHCLSKVGAPEVKKTEDFEFTVKSDGNKVMQIALERLFNLLNASFLNKHIFNFIEFHTLEREKSLYFINGKKNTIFGEVPQHRIQKYVNKKTLIDKRMVIEEVSLPDAELFEGIIAKQNVYLQKMREASNEIISSWAQYGYDSKELIFLTEQTGKPYFKDLLPMSGSEKLNLGLNYAVLLFWTFIIALPISQVFYHAFNGLSDHAFSNDGFKFSTFNFDYLFHSTKFLTWFKNTLIIALAITGINLIATSLLAYALSRFRFKGRKPAFTVLMIVNMFPSIAGLTSYIVLNRLIQEAFIPSPYIIMGLVYSGTSLLGFSFVVKNFLDTVSKEIDDAAKIDGASNTKIFFKIILPLITPILGVVAIQSFIIPFVDIMMPKFFITNQDEFTLPLGLTFLINNPIPTDVHMGAYTAGALLVAVPMTMVYFGADIFLKQNKTQGAIKG